jgi:outer membrane protein
MKWLRGAPVGCIAVAVMAASEVPARGQSLPETLQYAAANYPSVRVSSEQLRAAAANIALVRTAYLPRADFLGQVNRATRNNVFGMLLPQNVLPGISGPPMPENDMRSVWGTATGFLVSWEPFDFGLRQAQVDTAEAARRRAEATVMRTRFEVSLAAADAYLTTLAAEQAHRAAQAQVDRATLIEQMVEALTRAELRPGADLSRSRAETAQAEIQVVQAQNAVDAALVTLHQLTGREIRPQAGALLNAPQSEESSAEGGAALASEHHPVAREQAAAVAEREAERRSLDKAYYPRFSLQAAGYARGTGAVPDGTILGGLSGLGPNIFNWGVGGTLTFPLFELASIRARKQVAEHRRLAESARYEQVTVELNAGVRKAQQDLVAARRVAALIPRQLEAARAAEQQAAARYRAGVGTLVEVADAQRLLTQAEIDHALAQLNVWRALLHEAAARGDLEPFLDRVK